MPISDYADYTDGHFGRVYDHIIKPACVKAGFTPDRADEAQHTHVIMMNILQRILDSDMVLCDLSSKNPNVLYELGIRQAFDKPVTLIKDERTTRIFDTGMLSDFEYNSDLRIDNVQAAIDAIAPRLRNTYEKKDKQVNSLIQLMKIQPAKMPAPTTISSETTVILEAINTLGRRISSLESPTRTASSLRDARKNRECYSATRKFLVVLQTVDGKKIDDFTSLFQASYPTVSTDVEKKNKETRIVFTFRDALEVAIDDLYMAAMMSDVTLGASGLVN
jgi:hypothetical protein